MQLSGDSFWGTVPCGRRRGRRGWGQVPCSWLCRGDGHGLCHPRRLRRRSRSTGPAAGETTEGKGPGEEDKGEGWHRGTRTEGRRGRQKGSDTWLQEMMEAAGDNKALAGRELSFLRRARL